MSGAFGRTFAPKEFGLAAIAFGWVLGRPWPSGLVWGSRIINSGLARAWADKLLFGIRLGACRLCIIPWAALCETGRAQGRIYKIGVGRAWADKLLSGIRLVACRLCVIPWAALCETGWAQSRIYKIGAGRPWAEIGSVGL